MLCTLEILLYRSIDEILAHYEKQCKTACKIANS